RAACLVEKQPPERVVGNPRDPRRRAAEPRQGNRGVEFRAADLHVERTGLFQPLKVRRTEANHRFAESDYFVGHVAIWPSLFALWLQIVAPVPESGQNPPTRPPLIPRPGCRLRCSKRPPRSMPRRWTDRRRRSA